MNYDIYGEVTNGDLTYKAIAEYLRVRNTIGIGWTDEHFSHYDIIFSLGLDGKVGCFQRGIKQNYLFISIIDYTSYGFNSDSQKHPEYIKEKLRMNHESGDKIAELINGIIRELNREE